MFFGLSKKDRNKNMENKIILTLIKKDLEELGMLVEALQNERSISKALIDITLTKAQTLINEFQLLKAEPDISSSSVAAEVAKEEKQNELPQEKQSFTDTTNAFEPEKKPSRVETTEQSTIQDTIEQSIASAEPLVHTSIIPDTAPKETLLEAFQPMVDVADKPEAKIEEVPLRKPDATKQQTEIETIQPQTSPVATEAAANNGTEKKVLGEKFTKEPSLNERLSMNMQHDTKVKAKPIVSLKGAIGINDRFLFTRELFANDGNTFEQAIQTLDQAGSFQMAIEFLEQNFKWQKSETSLKFIDLIKRRYNNN